MLIIPLPVTVAGPLFSQRTQLGGQDYVLRYRLNARTDSWALDIDVIGEEGALRPVLTGKKLFAGHDLLRSCTDTDRPPGTLYVVRFDGTRRAPSSTDIGICKLLYFEPGETFD